MNKELQVVYTDKEFNSKEMGSYVQLEHAQQIGKWGNQTHTPFEWLAYTTEELGELSKAICEYIYRNGSKEDIFKEALQVATLALKIAHMSRQENL